MSTPDDGERGPNRFPFGRFAVGAAAAAAIRMLPLAGDADGLHSALAERWREILPTGFTVVQEGVPGLHVSGRRGHYRGEMYTGSLLQLRLPLPVNVRIRLYFDQEARQLQKFVSGIRGGRWPAEGAEPHVEVDEHQVRVWYGDGPEASAALRWRPIPRSEIGL
jgi:hypothetical protein